MERTKVSIFAAFLLFMLLGGIWLHHLPPPFIEVSLNPSKEDFPLVAVEIQGRNYPLQLLLGSGYPLALSKDCLADIQKSSLGEFRFKNIRDEICYSPIYEIPCIKFGKYTSKGIVTLLEKNPTEESAGAVKWPLDKINLLCDLPHLKVYGIHRAKDLPKFGIDLKKMKQVKGRLADNGMIVPVTTSFGTLNMFLSFNSNLNMIQKSLLKDEEREQNSVSTPLYIENWDFGEIEFMPRLIPPGFEVDGFLGIEFLKNHIVYIDGKKDEIYFGEKHGNTLLTNDVVKLPLDFTINGLPITDIAIRDKIYKGMIDLGSSQELMLPPDEQPPENLRLISGKTLMNVWGETAPIQLYALPQYRLGKAQICNLTLSENGNLSYLTDFSIDAVGDYSGPYAIIGRPLLDRTNLYCDCSRKSMWLVSDISKLAQVGVELANYEKISFELAREGIILLVKTDFGELRYLLDTGATNSAIKSKYLESSHLSENRHGSAFYESQIYHIGNQSYGPEVLYPIDISDEWPCDGIIGMDFLRKHPFYIDYQNRWIYFAQPTDLAPK